MNGRIRRIMLLLAATTLTGCAYGTQHSDQSAQLELSAPGGGSVTVGV
jgi:hypothetical protein